MPKTQSAKRAKVAQVLGEFAEGELSSGSGAPVKRPKQALAIALSEAGLSKPKRTARPASRTKARAPDLVTVNRR